MVTVHEVTFGSPGWREFLSLPRRVYADDPRWVPVPESSAQEEFLREPFRGRQAFLLARVNGRPTARCVARIARFAGGTGESGVLGAFEALDHPEAASGLFAAVEAWLRDRGANRAAGPMDGDTWHNYRVNVGPFDAEPFLKEPWNPPYYADLWRRAGYAAVATYASKVVADSAAAATGLAPAVERAESEGYGFRPLDLAAFPREMDTLYRLSSTIFSANRFYTPLGRDEFQRLYQPLRPLLRPGFVQFAHDAGGQEVGFVFGYPDFAPAVRAMGGRGGLFARVRFLLARRRTARFCLKTIGCLPEARGLGVGAALMGRAFAAASAAGYRTALMCLYHEKNRSGELDGGGGRPFRRYQLFAKELS